MIRALRLAFLLLSLAVVAARHVEPADAGRAVARVTELLRGLGL